MLPEHKGAHTPSGADLRRAALCLVGLVAWSAGCSSGLGSDAASKPQLTLTETFSQVVPDTFPITGIAPSPDGLMALWSRERSYLLVGAGGTYQEVGAGTLRRPIGVAVTSRDTIEVVDAERQEILTFAGNRLRRVKPFQLPLPAQSAAHADGKWFFSAIDSSLTTNIIVLEPSGSARSLYRSFQPPAGKVPRPGASLSPTGDGIVVTQIAAPFEALRLGSDGRTTRISRPDTAALNPYHDDQSLLRPLWVGMATLWVDGHYLRTFADARADRRVLFLYTGDGRLLRKTSIDAPLAFAATVPGQQLLIGVRRLV